MNIRPVGAELLHTDRLPEGRTDMTKLTVAIRNFANAPKNTFKLPVPYSWTGQLCRKV